MAGDILILLSDKNIFLKGNFDESERKEKRFYDRGAAYGYGGYRDPYQPAGSGTYAGA